ncbi:uncharacterized protein LOC115989404 isoform X2 [Quercus lobata]|uniref:uncharacterized protein LOC115962848 isoform X2 n=1 Tax=Quercus lobata TaxID=97700 RepID=UPI001249439A|nr:uncharacterized protein LOC115962848 isoform X2 [Quercus lobata]XP_030968940.1 uncharacterized protein LOC115989404 isoform X2 [Quercus lobata]
MWTPPCQLHLKPPTERLYRLSRYRLRTLSRWRLCGDRDARVRMLPIAGPVMVRLDLSGHMGGNENIIKCLSVCLYFLPIGDWNKHAKCSTNWGESWWLCIYFWIIAWGEYWLSMCLLSRN